MRIYTYSVRITVEDDLADQLGDAFIERVLDKAMELGEEHDGINVGRTTLTRHAGCDKN